PRTVVPKDTLIDAAWSGQIVEESNLTVQIAALRRVLGEAPGGERWIETLPRRGYRFIGPVVTDGEGAIASPPRADFAQDRAVMRHDEAEGGPAIAMSHELVGVRAGAVGSDQRALGTRRPSSPGRCQTSRRSQFCRSTTWATIRGRITSSTE